MKFIKVTLHREVIMEAKHKGEIQTNLKTLWILILE